MRLHVDTDAGDNPDDDCALAFVLGRPDVEVVAVTTVDDPEDRRRGHVERLLRLAGRPDVRVVSGADVAATQAALRDSLVSGARIAALGPLGNLARLAGQRPDVMDSAVVTVMGGWLGPPGPELPAWGPDRDHNIQADVDAAAVLWASRARLTLVPVAVAGVAWLREGDLRSLRETGPLGRFLARTSSEHAARRRYGELGRAHAGLPTDLVNFHFDPVACAAALGWPGVRVEERRLSAVVERGLMRFELDAGGRRTTVATSVDGDAFATEWSRAVAAADTGRGC